MEEGLKTLLALYQGTGRGGGSVSKEAIALAKEQGYYFDYPAYETHATALDRLEALLTRIDPKDVANAFLFSLSTRRLEYRSALGSYYYAKAVPRHALMHSYNEILVAAEDHCYFCGWHAWKTAPKSFENRFNSLNILNFERYRYGGVRHTKLNYAIFDLEQFLKLPKVEPTEADKRIFREILACVGALAGSEKVGKLRDTISKAKIFRSNRNELSVLLDELGICGILAGKEAPAYDEYFANEYERSPVEHTNDFAYPVNRWHAADGINTEKLKEIFGDGFLTACSQWLPTAESGACAGTTVTGNEGDAP